MQRKASPAWQAGIRDGKGTISTESTVLSATPYSFSTRFESVPGTNPEELLAASHAGCFTMALSLMLGESGIRPERIDTTATVTLEKLEGGFTVTKVQPRRHGRRTRGGPGKVRGRRNQGQDQLPDQQGAACGQSRWMHGSPHEQQAAVANRRRLRQCPRADDPWSKHDAPIFALAGPDPCAIVAAAVHRCRCGRTRAGRRQALNDRLDYFGSTVNIAARLPGFAQGGELIFSEEIRNDPEVNEFLTRNIKTDALSRFQGKSKASTSCLQCGN